MVSTQESASYICPSFFLNSNFEQLPLSGAHHKKWAPAPVKLYIAQVLCFIIGFRKTEVGGLSDIADGYMRMGSRIISHQQRGILLRMFYKFKFDVRNRRYAPVSVSRSRIA